MKNSIFQKRETARTIPSTSRANHENPLHNRTRLMRHLTDEQIWDMMDGLTTMPEKTLYQTHLLACAACHARYQSLAAVNAQLSRLPLETPSLTFTDTTVARWEAECQLAPAALQQQRSRTLPLVFSAILAIITVASLVLVYRYPAAMPAFPAMAKAMNATGQLLASKSVLNGMLLANALLLLWLFNQRVLAPFFRSRMPTVRY